jgi:Spy/CpxP family protein refolding chaperone
MFLNRKTFAAGTAVAAVLMFASASFGQASTQAPPPAGPMGALNLTQAQRDQIRTLREAQRKDSQALREQMRAARQQLQQALKADVPDEAAVRAAAGAVAALQTDQAVLQARAKGQLMTMLTPEQQGQLKEARVRAAQRAQRAMRMQRQRMRRGQMMGPQYQRRWRDWM